MAIILGVGRLASPAADSPPAPPAQASQKPAAEATLDTAQTQAEAAKLKRDALTAAVQVSEAYPEDALSYALLGSACHNTGKSEEAAKHLQKCLELNPKMADAYEVLALIAYENGNPDEAVRLSRAALELGPPNPTLLNRLGRALLDLGQTEEAITALRKAPELPQPNVQGAYLLGQAYLQSGDLERAKESFRRTLTLVPDHTQAYFGLYTACLRLGQAVEAQRAQEQFQKLEAIDRHALTDRSAQEETLSGLPFVRETVARTWFGAAQIHKAHGQPARAVEALKRAALLDADNPGYRSALEAHFVQAKALDEGVAAFEELAREQPANGLNAYFLGRIYGRMGRLPEAERAYRRVQQWDPTWPQGYRALAEMYLRANREPAEALTLSRKVVELDPSGPHFFLLAQALVRNGKRPAAVEAMQQAVALLPGEARYRDFLQQIQKAP